MEVEREIPTDLLAFKGNSNVLSELSKPLWAVQEGLKVNVRSVSHRGQEFGQTRLTGSRGGRGAELLRPNIQPDWYKWLRCESGVIVWISICFAWLACLCPVYFHFIYLFWWQQGWSVGLWARPRWSWTWWNYSFHACLQKTLNI